MKMSDVLIGFSAATVLAGLCAAGYTLYRDPDTAAPTVASTTGMDRVSSARQTSVDKGKATEIGGNCPRGTHWLYDRVSGKGRRCKPDIPDLAGETVGANAASSLTPDQVQAEARAERMAGDMEAKLAIIEAAQRVCGGKWRFQSSDGESSYTLEIGKLRYILRPDQGAEVAGTAEPTDRNTLQMIQDSQSGDAGVEQHFLTCHSKTAVLSGEHVGDEVMLKRL